MVHYPLDTLPPGVYIPGFHEVPSVNVRGLAHLLVVYVAWLAILVALYPASRWFAEVKRRRREWWLNYL